MGGIVSWAILQRVNEERIGYRDDRNLSVARTIGLVDAIEIPTLCQGVVSGRIQGVTFPACSFVFRAGSIFVIRLESTLMEGEITRLARMRGRTHISAGNLIPDFGQFRTTLQIPPHFLADREVVTFGPGYYRICLLREAISQIADLFILTDGATNPNDRIAPLTHDPTK